MAYYLIFNYTKQGVLKSLNAFIFHPYYFTLCWQSFWRNEGLENPTRNSTPREIILSNSWHALYLCGGHLI
ncbi:hypothetical protein V6N13_138628 [Hibiscus sabdariffa]|uniref:Uncharacterized protein n=1 Tax=Hibiscus sabdariffa TaxID=183260 RepID=A0ABR2PJE4_9ROSI